MGEVVGQVSALPHVKGAALQGDEMHTGADASGFQLLDELISGYGEKLRPKPENKQMP